MIDCMIPTLWRQYRFSVGFVSRCEEGNSNSRLSSFKNGPDVFARRINYSSTQRGVHTQPNPSPHPPSVTAGRHAREISTSGVISRQHANTAFCTKGHRVTCSKAAEASKALSDAAGLNACVSDDV
ncbi:unnamed protein product, partial [Iphiclides podalirius]